MTASTLAAIRNSFDSFYALCDKVLQNNHASAVTFTVSSVALLFFSTKTAILFGAIGLLYGKEINILNTSLKKCGSAIEIILPAIAAITATFLPHNIFTIIPTAIGCYSVGRSLAF